jgi:hypothetical protein
MAVSLEIAIAGYIVPPAKWLFRGGHQNFFAMTDYSRNSADLSDTHVTLAPPTVEIESMVMGAGIGGGLGGVYLLGNAWSSHILRLAPVDEIV